MSEIRLPSALQAALQESADALSLSLPEVIDLYYQTAFFWQQHLEELPPQFLPRLNVAMARHESVLEAARGLT